MPTTTQPWLGIDFGTCRTRAAILIGRELRDVNLTRSAYSDSSDMPTAVFFELDGKMLIGEQAVGARARDASRYLHRFKLEMERTRGKAITIGNESRTMAWVEIVAEVLAFVRRVAERDYSNNLPITRTTLTVPALYVPSGDGHSLMEEAAHRAGFREVQIIREPQAAALYYDYLVREAGRDTGSEGELVLIYDLGGGTFDPALLRRSGTNYPIERAQGAGVRCGGIFFDEVLRRDFLAKCPEWAGLVRGPGLDPVDERRYARSLIDIEEFLTDCKHGFSQPGVTGFDEPAPPPSERNYRITLEEFNGLISAMLDATIECCVALLGLAGAGWKDVTRILLVGGSCNLPVVREKLQLALERGGARRTEICWQRIAGTDTIFDPRSAVARGAAVAADFRAANRAAEVPANGRDQPSAKRLGGVFRSIYSARISGPLPLRGCWGAIAHRPRQTNYKPNRLDQRT